MIATARVGLGEQRPLLEAPGHLFDPHDYENLDQLEISEAQWRDVALIASFMSLVMMAEWDGWLIAQGCHDLIEFWEGNVLLYSSDMSRLREGEEILTTFECERRMR